MRLCSRATVRLLVPGLLLAGLYAGSAHAQQSAPANTGTASAPATPAAGKQKRKHPKRSAAKVAPAAQDSAASAAPQTPAVAPEHAGAGTSTNQPVTTSFGPVIRAPQATGTVAQGGQSFPTVKMDLDAAPLPGRRSYPDAEPGTDTGDTNHPETPTPDATLYLVPANAPAPAVATPSSTATGEPAASPAPPAPAPATAETAQPTAAPAPGAVESTEPSPAAVTSAPAADVAQPSVVAVAAPAASSETTAAPVSAPMAGPADSAATGVANPEPVTPESETSSDVKPEATASPAATPVPAASPTPIAAPPPVAAPAATETPAQPTPAAPAVNASAPADPQSPAGTPTSAAAAAPSTPPAEQTPAAPAAASGTPAPSAPVPTAPVSPSPNTTPAPAPPAPTADAPAQSPATNSTPATDQTTPPTPAPDAAAPTSAGDATAPTVPAPAGDNQATNPSLPSPQVNEAEPPPASRFDIFGGYTYLRPSGSVGTFKFPEQNTRGYIASGTYYFSRHFGVQAEFSHSEYPLGTTGVSPAPPFVQLGGLTDSFYTVEAGPVYRFFLGQRVIPFVHFTVGGADIAGPKFQPLTWGYGFNGGGGVDLLIPHTHEHLALRAVQADYGYMHADQGALQQYDLAGGTQSPSALRLSAGLVYRFGEMNPIPSKSLACDATPADVFAGERVTLAATLRNYKDRTKHPFFFTWQLNGGKQQGFGPVIFVDTTGLAAGTYHATAHISLKEKGKQFAQCSANYTVKESPAPTLKCSPDPSTVTPGQVSTITAYATSIAQRKLTYSYTTSEGQISGTNDTAQLRTDGLPPGVANITCKVQDDLGRTAVATTEVTIAPPALPPAPKAQPLCTVYFNRDMRRPARVDNEGRACLDDIALTLEHQPDARLVLVGEHSDSEADGQLTAAERAMNTRAYLAAEKGIDPSRVDVRTSTTPGRQVQTFLLAPGAIFDQPTEGRIDETKIKIHGQQYARQQHRAEQKEPVGEGVSHPPKH